MHPEELLLDELEEDELLDEELLEELEDDELELLDMQTPLTQLVQLTISAEGCTPMQKYSFK